MYKEHYECAPEVELLQPGGINNCVVHATHCVKNGANASHLGEHTWFLCSKGA